MQCKLCYHKCDIETDLFGKCGVIQNQSGHLTNPFYGKCSLVAIERVEKRPFFHYRPGSKLLSVGLLGCNLKCKFCQNDKISHFTNADTKEFKPYEIAEESEKKADGIVFTFNEPTIHCKFITEVGQSGGAPILVKTNGFASDLVWSELSQFVSGYNVDIKGNNDDYETCGGSVSPVLDSIVNLQQRKHHLEISLLVLPSRVEDFKFFKWIRDFLYELNPSIPVHILYLYPFLDIEKSYPRQKLCPIAYCFSEKMKYVYISNVYDSFFRPFRNTYCPSCGSIMVERQPAGRIHKVICCDNDFSRTV